MSIKYFVVHNDDDYDDDVNDDDEESAPLQHTSPLPFILSGVSTG